jgi:hypothetical protein
LDRAFGAACPVGETCAGRTMDRPCCRHCMCGRGRLAAGVLAAGMGNLSPDRGAGTVHAAELRQPPLGRRSAPSNTKMATGAIRMHGVE